MSTTWQIQQRWHRKTMPDCAAPYDVIVVGGGVNGAGVARDAAGRGARVLLLEAGDLAQRSEEHTSKLQSLMRISYAVFCLKTKRKHNKHSEADHNRTAEVNKKI